MSARSRRAAAPGSEPIDLTHLGVGDRARLLGCLLPRGDVELLESLGMTEACELCVCQVGDPCIVQVRATRIGLADAVARAILVLPEPRS